ncbi:hypothetical protein BC832DRAFT_569700 [Gaertneriomyces semiglobifer]|nr:hypothetical protein BC832DRAFT_569700 [Gaertneriomyces semiglobifer]
MSWRLSCISLFADSHLSGCWQQRMGGAVVAYDVTSHPNGRRRLVSLAPCILHVPRNIASQLIGYSLGFARHWASHEQASEWYQNAITERGWFGKRSLFFQTGPWIEPPAPLPVALPVSAAANAEVIRRRPTEVALVVGAYLAQVPPVVLRMLAEGMLDVGEEVCMWQRDGWQFVPACGT